MKEYINFVTASSFESILEWTKTYIATLNSKDYESIQPGDPIIIVNDDNKEELTVTVLDTQVFTSIPSMLEQYSLPWFDFETIEQLTENLYDFYKPKDINKFWVRAYEIILSI